MWVSVIRFFAHLPRLWCPLGEIYFFNSNNPTLCCCLLKARFPPIFLPLFNRFLWPLIGSPNTCRFVRGSVTTDLFWLRGAIIQGESRFFSQLGFLNEFPRRILLGRLWPPLCRCHSTQGLKKFCVENPEFKPPFGWMLLKPNFCASEYHILFAWEAPKKSYTTTLKGLKG